MLRQMSRSDWLAWMEWASVRGPIGGPRADFYTSYLAMHIRASQPGAGDRSAEDYKMPWLLPKAIE